jgi:hypothetical protein
MRIVKVQKYEPQRATGSDVFHKRATGSGAFPQTTPVAVAPMFAINTATRGSFLTTTKTTNIQFQQTSIFLQNATRFKL